MKYWDESLRVCQKCGAKSSFKHEDRLSCEKCGSTVWFFNFRDPPPSPNRPTRSEKSLWRSKLSIALLVAVAIFGLVALVGIFKSLIVVVASTLSAVGFAIFGFMRHAETSELEDKLSNVEKVYDYSCILEERVEELTQRYKHLLRTGDKRIEHYYEIIYQKAKEERIEAARLSRKASSDRLAVESVEQRIDMMAERLVCDNLNWVSKKLRADPENYQRQKKTLTKTFDFVESVGYELPNGLRRTAINGLIVSYKEKVREQALKEEQRQIKQQMRDEKRAREEQDRLVKEAEQKEKEIRRHLDEALKQQKGQYNAEIEELKRQLEDAQMSSERAKSMAQLTKRGHVYILSNIGSFGENVFKVGMTRRLDPQDRVKELGDASVPFPFDVHAMISCDNAPTLEKELHHELTRFRVNRVNFRKEYFKVDLQTIVDAVNQTHGKIEYIAEPEALEFRETNEVTPDELVEVEEDLVNSGVDFESDDDDDL